MVIDVVIQSDGNIRHEKLKKYQRVKEELEKMWKPHRQLYWNPALFLGHTPTPPSDGLKLLLHNCFRRLPGEGLYLWHCGKQTHIGRINSGPDRHNQSFSDLSAMNLARIHDKHKLRNFWEQKIERHSQMIRSEETRMKRSALSKLREEWVRRLQNRNQQLNDRAKEEKIKKAQRLQEVLCVLRSN